MDRARAEVMYRVRVEVIGLGLRLGIGFRCMDTVRVEAMCRFSVEVMK